MQRDLSDPTALPEVQSAIPKELLRLYEVNFICSSQQESLGIRKISAGNIGKLIRIRGIVTRITEVRPMMRVATYICGIIICTIIYTFICGNEIYQLINKRKYRQITECSSQQCQQNRNRRPILPQTRGSKFVKFQEIKLQELPEQVPEGNVPRSINIYTFGELTRKCQCGDKITIDGIWLPMPNTTRAGLTSNTYLHCMNIIKEKKGYNIDEPSYSNPPSPTYTLKTNENEIKKIKIKMK